MNKKPVLTTVFMLTLAVAVILGAQLANSALANPFQGAPQPEEPDLNQPSILLQLPTNKTYATETVSYSISVNKPPSWFADTPAHSRITTVSYMLDEEWRIFTIVDQRQNESEYLSRNPLDLKGDLTGLSEGSHNLRIKVESISYYYPPERANLGYGWWLMPPEEYKLTALSEKVYFAVDVTEPEVSVLSPGNTGYNSSEVVLNFLVSELNANASYSLDGQENETVSGNVTLTGLLAGEHNVTVYARDEAGNVGASETVIFNVTEPEYFPDFSSTWAAPAAGTAVTLLAVLGFSYMKKAKWKRQPQT